MPPPFRDRLGDGILITVMGGALVVAALALFWVSEEPPRDFRFAGLCLFTLGLAAMVLGYAWIARKVSISNTQVAVKSVLGVRTIAVDEIVSIRLRRVHTQRGVGESVLVVRGGRGQSIAVSLRAVEVVTAITPWLDEICDRLAARWRAQVEAGQTVEVSRRTQLTEGSLQDGGRRIEFARGFDLKEIPATPTGAALLTLTTPEASLVLESDQENFGPLRKYLVARSTAGTPRITP